MWLTPNMRRDHQCRDVGENVGVRRNFTLCFAQVLDMRLFPISTMLESIISLFKFIMSVTTTTTTSSMSILADYEVHHSGGEPASAPANAVSVPQPADWPTDHRRMPAYRPTNRNLDYNERTAGTDNGEFVFIQVMLHGVWLNAVCVQLLARDANSDLVRLLRVFGGLRGGGSMIRSFIIRLEGSGSFGFLLYELHIAVPDQVNWSMHTGVIGIFSLFAGSHVFEFKAISVLFSISIRFLFHFHLIDSKSIPIYRSIHLYTLSASPNTNTIHNLSHLLIPNMQLLSRSQNIEHTRPLGCLLPSNRVHNIRRYIAPGMVCTTLHSNITPLQETRLSRIQNKLDLALKHNAIVQ